MSSTTTSPTLSNYRYYDEQHPIFLNYICTVNGFHPRKLDKKFSYCYIGKRSSVTLNVLAQLFPKAFFQGITADRDDKITGTKLAKEANLPNITFTEGTLATVDPKDLPDFDYIVIHDFYSSLISETPTQLHNLLEKKLKERGILFISYICSPGGHSIAEICDLAAYSTLSLETDLKGKAAAALDLLQHLKTNQAAYFEDNTIASLHIEKMLKLFPRRNRTQGKTFLIFSVS